MKIRSRGRWWRVVLVLAPLAALIALALATTGPLSSAGAQYGGGGDQYGGRIGPIDPALVEEFGIGNDMLFIANGRASNVAVIDVATMEIVDYLPVPRPITNVMAAGGQAYKLLQNTLQGINDTKLPYTVHDMFYWEIHGVVASADRKSVYAQGALSFTPSDWTLYQVDAATHTASREINMPVSLVGYCGIEYDRNDESSGVIWAESMQTGAEDLMALGGSPLKLHDPLAGVLPALGLGGLVNNVENQLPMAMGGLSEINLNSGTMGRFVATDYNGNLNSSTCGLAWDKSGTRAFASQMFEPLITTINWGTKQLTGEILPMAPYTGQAMHQSTSAKERGLLITASGPNGVQIFSMNLNTVVGAFNMGQLGAASSNIHGVEVSPVNEDILYVTGDGHPWGGTYVVDISDIRAPKIIGGVEMGIDIAACGTYAISDKQNYYAASGITPPGDGDGDEPGTVGAGASASANASASGSIGASLPVVGDILGGGSGLPVVGDVLGGGSGLPVVGDLLGGGLLGGNGGLPIVGNLLGGDGGLLGLVLGLLSL